MYRNILFPTDGSESAEVAFEHALNLAKAFDSTLHVLYVVDTTYAGVGATGRISIDSLRERGESVVQETEDRVRADGIDVVTHIEEGDPYHEILAMGETADVIVIGTRGRSGLDRYLLGSVTEKVVRTSDTPVFTVRGGEDE